MARPRMRTALFLCGAVGLVAGCDGLRLPIGGGGGGQDRSTEALALQTKTRLVARDVEAPEVFQMTADGSWDGTPSKGGVWVAHPAVDEPERVIIRYAGTGSFVIGALFPRDDAAGAARFEVSSDAAAALGLAPGMPAPLEVTALRREEVGEAAMAALEAVDAASAAPEPRPDAGAPDAAAARPPEDPRTPPPAQPSTLAKPYVQIGFFSVEANARRTAEGLRRDGILPTVRVQETSGKTYWRVIVGPAADAEERAALLETVRGQGFADAYFVTN